MTLPGQAIHTDCYMLAPNDVRGNGGESELLWLKIRVWVFSLNQLS